MRKLIFATLLCCTAVLAACVTINVYFPAADVNEAAQQFVEDIYGAGTKPQQPQQQPKPSLLDPGAMLLDLLIPSAYAQADITAQTAQTRVIQARMKQRFDTSLSAALASGAVGLDYKGYIVVRDVAEVPLPQRAALNQAVADENSDRDAVYREIAVANGNAGWQDKIRESFARQWVQQARPGWYYQDAAGTWLKK